MKTLINAAMVSFAMLTAVSAQVPDTIATAAFPSGKTFTLTVKKVVSSKSGSGGFVPSGVKIPPGIPKYKVGQKIKFTIGKSGELKWPDRSLPIFGDYDDRITYGSFATVENPYPDSGTVYINARTQPTKAEIYLYKKKVSGAVHTVLYELRRAGC